MEGRGSTDYRRGTSGGGVSTGGLYAFDVQNGAGVDRALGVQATGSDMTPGTIYLKIQTNTPSVITSLTINFEVHVYNDKSNSMYVSFAHSNNDIVYIDELGLDVETPVASTGGSWVVNNRNVTVNNINIPVGDFYYLRWSMNSNTGTTSRDEIAIDDIVINPSAAACPLAASPTTATAGVYARFQTCDGAQIYWNNGDGTDRIVVISTAPITGVPVDRTTYSAFPYFGQTSVLNAGEYVIYNGTGTQVNITGLSASTTYHLAVFEYNGGHVAKII